MIPKRLRLLISASQPIAAYLTSNLQREGHSPVRISPSEGISTLADTAERYGVDAVLAEVSTTIQFTVWNRAYDKLTRANVPIISITDNSQLERLERLKVTDFVIFDSSRVPPCNINEVEWRIFLAIRGNEKSEEEEIIEIGEIEIIPSRYEVWARGEQVILTLKEYELLRFLVSHKDKVFTREFLLSEIWGYDYYGGTRTVDVHIGRIRSKLDIENPVIRTVRGVGYMLEEATRRKK